MIYKHREIHTMYNLRNISYDYRNYLNYYKNENDKNRNLLTKFRIRNAKWHCRFTLKIKHDIFNSNFFGLENLRGYYYANMLDDNSRSTLSSYCSNNKEKLGLGTK